MKLHHFLVESSDQQMQKAEARAKEIFAENLDVMMGWSATSFEVESPLEAAFVLWAQALSMANGWDHVHFEAQRSVTVGGRQRRIDFVALPSNQLVIASRELSMPFPGIAVELDGHDFHERTRSQVIDRNARDRDLQSAGWTVFHFSGTEFYGDPERCLDEVVEYAREKFGEFEEAVFYARQGKGERQ